MSVPLTVSDLRQYEYCPRIPYFTHVLGLRRTRPTTYKMQEGLLEHEHVTALEERRSLRTYGLSEGERFFNVSLVSPDLNLTGQLDMLILTPTEAIPVEFKNNLYDQVGQNHLMQLAAYSLMIEERWQRLVERAFVHFIPTKHSCQVDMSVKVKGRLLNQLKQLSLMVNSEVLPDATAVRGRCIDCELRNFCPDVW